MRASEIYDLIIIGDQIGGYTLAAAAAQAGFKVLIVEGALSPTSIFEVPSGNFLNDLSWEPVFGLAAGSASDRFLKSLGVYTELDELFPPLKPSMQFLQPEARVDLAYTKENLISEWSREFPSLRNSWERFWSAAFSERYTKENEILSKMVARHSLPVWCENMAAVQTALFGSLLPRDLYSGAFRLSLQKAAQGTRRILGGKSALKERLIARLQVFGGAVKRGAWAEEVVFERGEMSGVLLSSFEGYVRARYVVGAMDARRFGQLLPKQCLPSAIERELKKFSPKFWRYSFSVRLPEEDIPEGLGDHAAIFDPRFQLAEENFLQVAQLGQGSYAGIGPQHKVLLVKCLVPMDEQCLKPDYLSALSFRVLRKLKEVIPHFNFDRAMFSPDPRKLETDPVFHRFYKIPHVSHIPSSMLVYETTNDPFGEKGLAMQWLPGVGLCSREGNPLYGLLGEFIAAQEYVRFMISERNERYMQQGLAPPAESTFFP